MNFAEPIWLLIGATLCGLLVWLFRRFDRKRGDALQLFAARHLLNQLTASVSNRRRNLKRLFIIMTAACFCVALARPQFGFRWEEARRKGIDILFAVDTSRSMLTQDVNPNRLTRAKLAVADLLGKLEGDRVGLIAFAGDAFLQCPFTLDYDAFRQSMEALDTKTIPRGGTDIASAIAEAEAAFLTGSRNHKILILITDGEDLAGNAIAAAQKAAKDGLQIFTVGVGTPSGDLIPASKAEGGIDFVKDENGQVVKSRLDETMLQKIAEASGGFYEPLGQKGEGLEAIYDHGLALIPKQELSSRMQKIYIERYPWPLALGILCLILEMFLGERRGAIKFKFKNSNLKITDKLQPALWLAASSFILHPLLLQASPQSAERAYRQGKFSDAMAEYKKAAEQNPKKTELQFNWGASAYKTGRFADSAPAFQKALQTQNVNLQEQAFYNLGNSEYRLGQPTEKTHPQQTIRMWQQSLQAYASALKLKRSDVDARFNYEFVKKKLEELQKQQPKDSPDQPEKDQPNENKNPSAGDHKPPERKEKQNQDQPSDQPNSSKGADQKGENKDPKNQQNKGGEGAKNNPAAQNQSPSPPAGGGPGGNAQPSRADGKRDEKKNGEDDPIPMAGQMSREEAKNLLDSLKGDEKKLPLTPARLLKGGGPDDETKRDW